MGRKIPGKKHRGVKDPYQQQLNRHSLVKDKINAAPADVDEQPIPESLQNIMQWRELAKEPKRQRKKKRNGLVDSRRLEDSEETLRGMTRPVLPTPAFIQHSGETNRRFLKRIDQMCEEVVTESKINRKSKKDFNFENEVEDETRREKRQKGNIEEIMLAGSKQSKKKKKLAIGDEPQLSKKEKVKLLLAGKKQARLDKIQEKFEESNRYRDNVAFGDVAHAPPTLTIPKRNQTKAPVESKPARRGLLLQQMLGPDKMTSADGMKKKTRSKYLPLADQERREKIRISAVQEYRKLKLNKSRGVLG